MSQSNEYFETETDPQVLIDTFFTEFSDSYSQSDKARIVSAWDYLIGKTRDLKRKCGKPYYLHPFRVARILAQKNLGADTIISCLFHNILEVDPGCLGEIEDKFGKDERRLRGIGRKEE